MINDDLFITAIVMFLVSVAAALALLVVLLITGINWYRNKRLKISLIEAGLILGSIFVLYLGVPFWCLAIAGNMELDKAETMHILSVKTSLLPSVRSFMEAELGASYMANFEGQKAIDAYEASIKIRDNKFSAANLCLLYLYKGDLQNAISMCTKENLMQSAAAGYILQNDYETSMEVVDNTIKSSQKVSCWNFAQKAYIYRKLGNQDMFKEFYKKAEALCPGNAALKRLYENKNYYSDFYMQKKKEFNF